MPFHIPSLSEIRYLYVLYEIVIPYYAKTLSKGGESCRLWEYDCFRSDLSICQFKMSEEGIV